MYAPAVPAERTHPLKQWGYLAFVIPAALPPLAYWLGVRFDALELCAFLTPFVVFVVVPILDAAIGRDRSNPAAEGTESPGARLYYRALPLACAALVPALLAWAGAIYATEAALGTLGRVGWVCSLGIVAGVLAINAAHELIHKASRHERLAGGLLLAFVCYGTFKVEHLRGHHVRVATPADASTARLGEPLYAFLPRAFAHNVAAAWRLEAQRLRRAGHAIIGPYNEALAWSAASAAIAGGFYAAFGGAGLAFFLAQSVVAIALLETVNYLEHYGLERTRRADGSYARTTHLHSWNSSFLLTNLLLFQLQRHSDHHAHPRRRYQRLRHHDDSPQLPAGYATMVLLAWAPPLWRRVMDPRVPQRQP